MVAAVSHFQINHAVTTLSSNGGVPKSFSVSIFCPFLWFSGSKWQNKYYF